MARLVKDDADVVLGEVVTTGKFVASMNGDGKLFFNYVRMPWKQPAEMYCSAAWKWWERCSLHAREHHSTHQNERRSHHFRAALQ
ncbi:hypothetical protein BV898_08940 [Hypsibius exemplaris]|uniref:Uncharacterized protein n=1 Tax=Hypsibius exemplaris TaxID=2072580 RepID=A0A1W0WNZ7_HYPEX|nr:hypothetical protein BV898_08940 [Hypsibius exemplaris]